MANIEIRTYAMQKGVRLYEIAEKIGCSESYFSRIMRKELTDAKKDEIMKAIDSISNKT